MDRRTVVCLALLAGLMAGCSEPPPPPPSRVELAGAAAGWSLLVISVDTLRADRLGAYGYQHRETSPRIDALLASGVRFEQASAPRSITWPSLATFLTGLYPSVHGVIENGYDLPDDEPTLPKLLHQEWYRTGAFLSNMCRANHQGWDAFLCTQGRDARGVTGAVEWAAELGDDRPYLLWVHLFGAHPPYYNGGARALELNPGYEGIVAPKKGRLDAIMKESIELDEADLRHLDAVYDAAVMGTDAHVARLLAELEAAGKLEKTVIVFLADHGEDLYQHNRYLYHACSPYQSSLHIPLAVVAPGLLPGGGVVTPPVEMVDVLPTLLDLLGLAGFEGNGVSLRPYLERPERGGEGKPAFSEYGDTRIHTVMAGSWKLIDNPDGITPICFGGGPPDLYPLEEVELFDLVRDPMEQENLAAAHPREVARLQSLIRSRFAQLRDRGEHQEIPEDLKEHLRSLGYVAD